MLKTEDSSSSTSAKPLIQPMGVPTQHTGPSMLQHSGNNFIHPNPSLASALQGTYGYHLAPEFFDPSRALGISRNSFDGFGDYSTALRLQQQQQLLQQQRLLEKLATQNINGTNNNGNVNSTTPNTNNSTNSETNGNGANNNSSNSASTTTTSTTAPSNGNAGKMAGVSEDRLAALYERETRWNEVRKYSEFIRRFATEASHMDVTKENYYDLYNMAVCLLKSVDSLDPDKFNGNNAMINNRKGIDYEMATQMPPSFGGSNLQIPIQQSELDLLSQQLQTRKSFDLYYNHFNRGSIDGSFLNRDISLLYNNLPPSAPPPASSATNTSNTNSSNNIGALNNSNGLINSSAPFLNSVLPQYQNITTGTTPNTPSLPIKYEGTNNVKSNIKNYTGEVYFDDLQSQSNSGNTSPNESAQEDKKPKRRRRRTVYSSRRNLHCHMCGVTETPEWRRGPAGDHTLCNACGLHYAKSLKKQKKEAEGRKHSIDMLLNTSQINGNSNSASTAPSDTV